MQSRSKENGLVVCKKPREIMSNKIFGDVKGREMLFCLDYWYKLVEINGYGTDLNYTVKQLLKYMIYLSESDVKELLSVFIEKVYAKKSESSDGTVVDNK